MRKRKGSGPKAGSRFHSRFFKKNSFGRLLAALSEKVKNAPLYCLDL